MLLWVPSYQAFDCQGQLTISISIPEGGPELFVGLEPVDTQAGRTQLAFATLPKLRPGDTPDGKLIFEDRPELLKRTRSCAISIGAVKDERKRLALHIKSKANQKIALLINGRRSLDLTIGKGGVFHDGKLTWETEGKGQLGFLRFVASGYSPNVKVVRGQ